MKSGNLNFLEPSGPLQACNGTALPLYSVTWCQGVWLGVVSVRVDYTVTNFDTNKSIKLSDSRFTVIFLDKLNKNKKKHEHIRCPSWDSNLAPIQAWSVTACSVFTDLHNLNSDIVRMGDSDLCIRRVERDPVTGARLLGQVLER